MKQPNSTTRQAILTCLLAGAAMLPTSSADPVPPQILNLVAAQRPGTFLVDVTYDLVDPDSQKIYVEFEATSTGGSPWLVPLVSLSGDVGLVHLVPARRSPGTPRTTGRGTTPSKPSRARMSAAGLARLRVRICSTKSMIGCG